MTFLWKFSKSFLKFLYTDIESEGNINYFQLFAAAGRLKIENLKTFAAVEMLEQINADNAVDILNLSNKYTHDELRIDTFEKIKEMYPNIKFMDEWAHEPKRVAHLITQFKEKEECIRKIEEDFKSLFD